MICLPLLVVTLALPLQGTGSKPSTQSRPSSRPAPSAETAKKPVKKREGGFFGFRFVEVPHAKGKALRVQSVQQGSDAARVGFREGDLILGVMGRRLQNGDHFIKLLYGTMRRGPRPRGMRPDPREPWIDVLRGGERARIEAGIHDLDENPAVGQKAPDFELKDPKGENAVRASTLWKEKPLFLVFGSYT